MNLANYFRATVLHSTNALYSLASDQPETYLHFAQKVIGAKAENAIRKFNEAGSLEQKIEIFKKKVSKYMQLNEKLNRVHAHYINK